MNWSQSCSRALIQPKKIMNANNRITWKLNIPCSSVGYYKVNEYPISNKECPMKKYEKILKSLLPIIHSLSNFKVEIK